MRYLCTVAAAGVAILSSSSAFSHVVLGDQAALANTSYRAALRVGHGCDGSPTTGLTVTIPAGFKGAKPMPKPGWTLSTKVAKLDKPYDDHGRQVNEDVAEISWSANSRDSWLPDSFYDEFVLRGGLPGQAGPMWFKVVQTCEKGANRWVEVPASGSSTKDLKSPAALLEIIESGAAGHQH